MKKFIKYIVLFALLVLGVGCVIELYLRSIPCDESVKRRIIEEHGSEIKNAIIGNSVAAWGIAPSYLLDSTYNVACQGQSIPSSKLMFEKYSSLMPHLKTLIWGMSVQSLWSDIFAEQFGRIGRAEAKIVREQIFFDFQWDNDIRCHSLLLSCPKSSLESTETYDSLGFNTLRVSTRSERDWSSNIEESVDRYKRLDTDEMRVTYAKNVQCVEDVVRQCKVKGIHVFFVMPPIYKGLADILPDGQFKEINEAMNKIVAKYDNASWHDYVHDTRFVKEDFIDENHLNADIGAVKFSKILVRDLFNYSK
jgi:hypothetical protein